MGVPKIDLNEKIWALLKANGLRPGSKSLSDYEYAKNVLALKAYRDFNCDYEVFIRTVVNYLEI